MARSSLKSVIRLIDAATAQVPPEKDFLEDLKRSIEISDSKGRKKGSCSYKPSSMHCIRQMYYIRTGKDTDGTGASYNLVGICNTGTDTHERIQKSVLDMKKNGIDCEYINVADFVRNRELTHLEIVKEPNFKKGIFETKLFHKDLNMSFLCDGVIKYKGKYYILEIKTESGNKFWSRDAVNPEHYNQGTAYSLSLGIDDVIFLYISRDTLDMKTFLFTPTGDMKQNVVGMITNCEGYVERQITPPKPTEIERKTCEYCDYKKQCRKDG